MPNRPEGFPPQGPRRGPKGFGAWRISPEGEKSSDRSIDHGPLVMLIDEGDPAVGSILRIDRWAIAL
jgi:hypothetical protein